MGKHKKNRLPQEQSLLLQNFEAKTASQQLLINLINSKEITIAMGPAGTGKTYVTLASALALLEKGFKKIVLIKSVTTIPGESIGFIPGGVDDKLEPYIMSYTWNIDKLCGKGVAKDLMSKELVEVLPLAFIRGLSIDNAIVIIDEAQNLDKHTFKTIITRIGTNSKYIFLGDAEQVDRKRKIDSCLYDVFDIFKDKDYVGTIEFTDEDCVRNPLIPKILEELRFYSI